MVPKQKIFPEGLMPVGPSETSTASLKGPTLLSKMSFGATDSKP